jgi:hypothetical protein
MSKKRRLHGPKLKARVALEARKGIEPVHAIAAKYQVRFISCSPGTARGLPCTARSLRSTLESIATPCSVNA